MPPQPDDFTCLAATKRLFPHAHIDAASVEGPYCAIRPAHQFKHGDFHIRLFADLMDAEAWARSCPCGAAGPHTHYVRVVEALEPAESVAFRKRADWTHHRAAELLQKWAYLAERLARGPATEAELNETLAAAEASGDVAWLMSDPVSEPPDCLPTLHWAHSHHMVKARYRDDLATIEFIL